MEEKQIKKVPKALVGLTAGMGVTIAVGAVVIVNLLNSKEEPTPAVQNIGMEQTLLQMKKMLLI